MKIFKKRIDFSKLLEVQCIAVKDGFTELVKYFDTQDEEHASSVILAEKRGDQARRDFVAELDKNIITSIDDVGFFNLSGLTPVGRKDLYALSGQLDEYLDYAQTTVEEMRVFNVKPRDDMKQIAYKLKEISDGILMAIQCMAKRRVDSKNSAIGVKKMVNEVFSIRSLALLKLFDDESLDFRMVLKYREIYRHLYETALVAGLAMDNLLHILVTL